MSVYVCQLMAERL